MVERGNAGRCSGASTASAVTRPRAWWVGTVSVSTRLCKRSSKVRRATSEAKTLKNSGIAPVLLRSVAQSPGGLPRHDYTECYCRGSAALPSIGVRRWQWQPHKASIRHSHGYEWRKRFVYAVAPVLAEKDFRAQLSVVQPHITLSGRARWSEVT